MSEPATKDDILRLEKATKDDILRLENSIKDLDFRMQQTAERLITLLQNNLDRLDSRQDSFLARFDNQADRLDRQAGLLQTGRIWTAKTDARIDKVESALEEKDRQIDAISARVRRLEERG
jgi:prefoldin subunit 5